MDYDKSKMTGELLGYMLSQPGIYDKLQAKAKAQGTTVEDMVSKRLKSLRLEGSPSIQNKAQGVLTGKVLNFPEFQDQMEYVPNEENIHYKIGDRPGLLTPNKKRNRERGKI